MRQDRPAQGARELFGALPARLTGLRWVFVAVFGCAAAAVALTVPSSSSTSESSDLQVLGAHSGRLVSEGVHPPTAESSTTAGARVIGVSVEGRAIEAYEVGTGSRVVAIIGGIHTGPESVSVEVVRGLMEQFREGGVPDGVRLVFIPCLNPDGLANDNRLNAAAVDLNRNWPTRDWAGIGIHTGEEVSGGDAPLSEPETLALHTFLMELRPSFTVSFHGYAGLVDDNSAGDAPALAGVYAEASGYEHIAAWVDYEITGQLIDALADTGLAAADVELLEDDPSSLERNRLALLAVMQALVES